MRKVHAAVRFLSVEPLLEHIGAIDLSGIHWVIVSGESGAKARPMEQDWAESVQRQAQQQNVAFFFKQWGAWGPDGVRRGKKQNGRELAGRQWGDFPVQVVSAA